MIVRTTDDLARLIRARREELGLSQEALADVTGLNRASISFIERGTRAGRLDTMLELLHVLGLDVDVRPRG